MANSYGRPRRRKLVNKFHPGRPLRRWRDSTEEDIRDLNIKEYLLQREKLRKLIGHPNPL